VYYKPHPKGNDQYAIVISGDENTLCTCVQQPRVQDAETWYQQY